MHVFSTMHRMFEASLECLMWTPFPFLEQYTERWSLYTERLMLPENQF
jgi:hypothetical protein